MHSTRLRMHHVRRLAAAQVHALLHQAAQVAISEDAQHPLLVIHHGGGAQALGAHLAHDPAKWRCQPHLRNGVAAAHHVTDMGQQLAAQRAARVRARKVFFLETARVQQRHSQRVAKRQLRRGARGGRQVQGAGFLHHAAVECDARLFGQRRMHATRDGNERHAEPAKHRQDRRELPALATVGNGQHQIKAGDHAQIAMAGFGRMHKQGRCACGSQRGGNLAADMSAFSHPHDDHAAPACQHQPNRLGKLGADTASQAQHGGGFYFKGLAGKAQDLLGIKGGGVKAHACIL